VVRYINNIGAEKKNIGIRVSKLIHVIQKKKGTDDSFIILVYMSFVFLYKIEH